MKILSVGHIHTLSSVAKIPDVFDGRDCCLLDLCSLPRYGLPRGVFFAKKKSVKHAPCTKNWVVTYSNDVIEMQIMLCAHRSCFPNDESARLNPENLPSPQ